MKRLRNFRNRGFSKNDREETAGDLARQEGIEMSEHALLGTLVGLSILLTAGALSFIARELYYVSRLVERVLDTTEEVLEQGKR